MAEWRATGQLPQGPVVRALVDEAGLLDKDRSQFVTVVSSHEGNKNKSAANCVFFFKHIDPNVFGQETTNN